MRISDVPQLISNGQYECDFSIIDFVEKINQYEKDSIYQLQMNPDFQRGHVWTSQQEINFLEEFFCGGCKHAKIFYFNWPLWNDWRGKSENKYTEFVCVDGLQRFTAFKNFTAGEIKIFGAFISEFEDAYMFHQNIDWHIKMNVNDLQTRNEVLEWYIQINAGGTPHTDVEIERVRNLIK